MTNCNCGGSPKLEGGNGLGAYYYLCSPYDVETVTCLTKALAEQAWEILVKFERKKK